MATEGQQTAVEKLAQAVLENRVQLVQTARGNTYEVRVKPEGRDENAPRPPAFS